MNDSEKLRVVQVGCGTRGQIHIKPMLVSGVIDLVALCDLDAGRLQAAGEQFGITRLYPVMQEMIHQEQPELVDIITPPTLRAQIVDPALAAGAPAILIEKPLALMPSEARLLVDWGRERLIAVNTQYQWMPHWQRFWPLLAERALGEVRLLRAGCGFHWARGGNYGARTVLKPVPPALPPDLAIRREQIHVKWEILKNLLDSNRSQFIIHNY